MQPAPEKPISGAGRIRKIANPVLAVLVGALIGLACIEVVLRYREAGIAKSNSYDPPDLFRYDAKTGWVLAPYWRGVHRHHDYQARYNLNDLGFREDAELRSDRMGKLHVFLGDSFTFGLGVNDSETFIHLLNQGDTNSYLNCAVPGFSTDQEFLLLERNVFSLKPAVVDLVVYLGNDLFDNELPFPLQAERGKPYAELGPTGLVFKNIPVPLTTKSSANAKINIGRMVLGEDYCRGLWWRLENTSAVLQLLGEKVFPVQVKREEFDARFARQLKLFFAIVERTRKACADRGATLNLILLPGRSYVEEPRTVSAQFQDCLRDQIVSESQKLGYKVIDVASPLRHAYQESHGKYFYPNDGHLNPAGHRLVARVLASELH